MWLTIMFAKEELRDKCYGTLVIMIKWNVKQIFGLVKWLLKLKLKLTIASNSEESVYD